MTPATNETNDSFFCPQCGTKQEYSKMEWRGYAPDDTTISMSNCKVCGRCFKVKDTFIRGNSCYINVEFDNIKITKMLQT